MPLGFLHRLLIVGTMVEIAINFLGLLTLLLPVPPDVKQATILSVLTITAAWDLVTIGYLLWVPVAAAAPALAVVGGPPAAVPVHHMSRTAIKTGLVTATLALLFAVIAIVISYTGVVGTSTALLVGIFLVLTLIQDCFTAGAVLRR